MPRTQAAGQPFPQPGNPVPVRSTAGVHAESLSFAMRDGTPIAVDVLLPADLAPGERLPAILVLTRYWRSFALRVPDPPRKAPLGPRAALPDFLVARGFAVVVVDARGSGASGGTSRCPWSPEELADNDEVAAWVAARDWCSGALGAYGISYEGASALRLAGAPGVLAVAPQEIEYDVYADIAFPGGIRNAAFLDAWSASNAALDAGRPSDLFPRFARLLIKGPRPVDADKKDRAQLAQAIAGHAGNTDVARAAAAVTFRDDPFGDTGLTFDEFAVPARAARIAGSGAAMMSWGSWLDGSSAEAALRTFNSLPGPQVAVIGAWKHEMSAHGSPWKKKGAAPEPALADQHAGLAAFFARTLVDGAPPAERIVHYFTLGEERWKSGREFPPAGTTTASWYAGPGGTLSTDMPATATATATFDEYKVDFRATTGTANRWLTQMARPLFYGDRRAADRRLLTYTSAPLDRDTEITGYPVCSLWVESDMEDGAFFAYLEEVDEHGTVRYVTEGQLRGIHRTRSSTPPPYTTGMPYHSCRRAAASPLPVGEPVELVIGLWPTSVLVRRGRRLRLALAGADADTFARVPESGTPRWRVYREAGMATRLTLPVVARD